jgi:hypothetical protein
MTCNDCTFCNEDILVLQNLMTDARARGNFRLANGLEKALRSCSTLQTKLTPANRAYLENIARITKSNAWPADEQTDLLIDAQQVIKIVKQNTELYQESKPQERGFTGMLNAAFHVQPTETDKPEATQPTSTFRSMLEEASGRNKQSHTTTQKTATMTGLLRQVDESQFPEKCNPELCPPDFSRHCRANTEAHRGQPYIYRTPRNR